MRILWLCNILLPAIAERLNLKASNKEGWLSGISCAVSKNHDFELGIACPVAKELDGFKEIIDGITYYGFYEDTAHPEHYDEGLEESMRKLTEDFKPDLVHVFGTEFPHTLAMAKCYEAHPDRILIGIQGVVEKCREHYLDGVPEYVINRVTFRDFLKKDSLRKQLEKFTLRAANEIKALQIAGNVTGRTPFDLEFTTLVNPEAKYHFMNETLRSEFYEGYWKYSDCEKHSIFLSQGNYPLKGLHVMLEAMPDILKKYPSAHIYVAGDTITRYESIKDKIKISSYGKYLRELIHKYNLGDHVTFTGSITAEEFKERMLKSNVFVCPSTIENSPNSLGEAMLLGVPSIASNVGGIPGIFKGGTDGFMFENLDAKELSKCVIRVFDDTDTASSMAERASMHAHITHNPETNYKRLLEIYTELSRE